MRVTIDSADNCEMYSVNVSWWTDEEGYTETTAIVSADELGTFLLQYMPYQPNQKKPENKHANVRPFIRR
jgi:hypothetical protein